MLRVLLNLSPPEGSRDQVSLESTSHSGFIWFSQSGYLFLYELHPNPREEDQFLM